MKQNTAQSNSRTLQDFRSLPAAQWQQYAEAARRFALPDSYREANETDEKGEAHSFWDEFLLLFNIRRRNFARHPNLTAALLFAIAEHKFAGTLPPTNPLYCPHQGNQHKTRNADVNAAPNQLIKFHG